MQVHQEPNRPQATPAHANQPRGWMWPYPSCSTRKSSKNEDLPGPEDPCPPQVPTLARHATPRPPDRSMRSCWPLGSSSRSWPRPRWPIRRRCPRWTGPGGATQPTRPPPYAPAPLYPYIRTDPRPLQNLQHPDTAVSLRKSTPTIVRNWFGGCGEQCGGQGRQPVAYCVSKSAFRHHWGMHLNEIRTSILCAGPLGLKRGGAGIGRLGGWQPIHQTNGSQPPPPSSTGF